MQRFQNSLSVLSWMVVLAGAPAVYAQGPAKSSAPAYVSFAPPGAFQTYPWSINDNGDVVGYYTYYYTGTQTPITHGFLRTANGKITTFDIGAKGTGPSGINKSDEIVGTSIDGGGHFHGFLREKNGKIIHVDVPGSTDTMAGGINDAGEIVGFFSGPPPYAPGYHAFLRDTGGNFTAFDVPGMPGTTASVINGNGWISGTTMSADGVWHGFLRDASGYIATFDPPGSQGTSVLGINSGGWVSGAYDNSDPGYSLHSFVRNDVGGITAFDPPGAIGSLAYSVNQNGHIARTFWDNGGRYHGFILGTGGAYTVIDVPGWSNTTARAINSSGVVAGTSCVLEFTSCVGFLRIP